mgnify:CR=1 FL=1
MATHVIDFEIHGEEMQYVDIILDPDETVVAEPGAFLVMDETIRMSTIFGDGSKPQGFLDKVVSAGKRWLTGEKLFMTAFTNAGHERSRVSFASPFPGRIIPVDLTDVDNKMICQKESFLCAAKGTSVGIEFSKRLGRGFFGGEGFIMQKLEGDGWAFLHACGTVMRRTLQPGELLRVDTGCLVGFTKDVDYDIEFVGGIKNTLFGGEGVFFVKLVGPGTVWLQSLPFSRLADRIIAHAPNYGGKRRGEGSVLGDLGDLIGGDRNI